MLILLDDLIAEKIKQTIQKIELDLVNGNYSKVVSENNSRLTAQEIEDTIKKFKGKISAAPEYVFDNLAVIGIKNSNPKAYHVDYELWIDNKKSDLTLQLIVTISSEEVNTVIEDIHIL